MVLDEHELWRVKTLVQDGVITRRQLLELGAGKHDVARMERHRELVRVHRGVYVDHTGPLTWEQRAWAAVLALAPAALTASSALPEPPRRGPVHVAIDPTRTPPQLRGVLAHRTSRWRERLAPGSLPPRLALPEAAVEVAASAHDTWDAFACFARVCHTRRTTPAAIADALRSRRGVRDRALLLAMLDDLATGACSVLEREYLVRVERSHGLPTGRRQQRERTADGVVYRDVDYPAWQLLVELDGRAFHDTPDARDRDLDRDLVAASEYDVTTLRLGHRQVIRDCCRTAGLVAAVLARRGWEGPFLRCSRCP